MEKKNEFSTPTRQSNLALLLLVWKYFRVVIRQSWPILILPFIGQKNEFALNYIIYGISAIVGISLIVSIIAFYRYYFYIKDNTLYIHKGVFRTSTTNIPFDRVQSINFEQNLLLRATEQVKVEIETAGSSKTELSIEALKQSDADSLRNYILQNRKESRSTEAIGEETYQGQSQEKIFSLSPIELFRIGITENHLRSLIWILGIFAYGISNLEEFGIDIYDIVKENQSLFAIGTLATLILGSIALLGFVMISVIRIFFKYYDLSAWRIPNGFKFYMGLLNRKDKTTPDSKIQMLRWGDNPLKRIFGIWHLWIFQARSASSSNRKSFNIPIGNFSQITTMLFDLYGEDPLENIETFPIHMKFFIRRTTYTLVFGAIILSGLYYSNQLEGAIIASVLMVYIIIVGYIRYRKSKFSINQEYLFYKDGVFGDKFAILPWYKAQTVQIHQNFYQQRHRLATITVNAASGSISIPYIPINQANSIANYVLFKTESDQREWM